MNNPLTITQAIFGVDTRLADVTNQLRAAVQDGILVIDPNLWTALTDAAPGQTKNLSITTIDSFGNVMEHKSTQWDNVVLDLRGNTVPSCPVCPQPKSALPWLIGLGVLWVLMN